MSKIRRLTIYTDKVRVSKKMLVYSDLHLGFKKGINISQILKYRELNPDNYDCILIPGDIVHCINVIRDEKSKKEVLSFLEKLTGATPVYYVLGNHDQYFRRHFEGFEADYSNCLVEAFSSLENFNWLANDCLVNFDGFNLRGINNGPSYYLDGKETNEAFLNDCRQISNEGSFSKDVFNILLVHDPKSIYRLKKYFKMNIQDYTDLVVSGHMHNAMVPNMLQGVMKGNGFVSPDFTILPEYSYGVRQEDDTLFLVNGAVNPFIEQEIINSIYGFNCTEITISNKDSNKKLMYTYK